MGLGKTMEVFALVFAGKIARPPANHLICHRNNLRHLSSSTLVIVPPSLVGQWQDEFHKHVDKTLSIFKFYGSSRPKNAGELLKYDIVLTTYGVLGSEMKKSGSVFDQIHWHRLVVDEAHSLKNPETLQCKMLKRIHATNRWCLTGTPGSNYKDMQVHTLSTCARAGSSMCFCSQCSVRGHNSHLFCFDHTIGRGGRHAGLLGVSWTDALCRPAQLVRIGP